MIRWNAAAVEDLYRALSSGDRKKINAGHCGSDAWIELVLVVLEARIRESLSVRESSSLAGLFRTRF